MCNKWRVSPVSLAAAFKFQGEAKPFVGEVFVAATPTASQGKLTSYFPNFG